MRKGQVFIVISVVFSSLILLTSFSYQQIIVTDDDPEIKFYFDSALEKQAEVFNSELKENYSIENLKKGFYSYNSFLKTRSSGKNIEYAGFQVIILPKANSTLVINYRDKQTDLDYYSGTWKNETVEPNQYQVIKGGSENPKRLEINDLGISKRFNSSKPTVLGYIRMEAESETWNNYIFR